MPSQYSLPPDFLSSTGPPVKVEKVDFTKHDLPAYADFCAVVLDDVLTAEECEQLVRAAEARTDGKWEQALINVGMGMQELRLDVRNCGRIIWDDRSIVEKIWNRVKDHVPEIGTLREMPRVTGSGPAKRKETWKMTRLNDRMRFLKYGSGEYFQPHCDGAYETPDGLERSYYTLHVYLNESDTGGTGDALVGGSTAFHSGNMQKEYKVHPKMGRVLVFQHRALLHSGEEVLAGTKLTLRTDLMYKKAE